MTMPGLFQEGEGMTKNDIVVVHTGNTVLKLRVSSCRLIAVKR
jgi:hypothetical protein